RTEIYDEWELELERRCGRNRAEISECRNRADACGCVVFYERHVHGNMARNEENVVAHTGAAIQAGSRGAVKLRARIQRCAWAIRIARRLGVGHVAATRARRKRLNSVSDSRSQHVWRRAIGSVVRTGLEPRFAAVAARPWRNDRWKKGPRTAGPAVCV